MLNAASALTPLMSLNEQRVGIIFMINSNMHTQNARALVTFQCLTLFFYLDIDTRNHYPPKWMQEQYSTRQKLPVSYMRHKSICKISSIWLRVTTCLHFYIYMYMGSGMVVRLVEQHV